MNYTPHGEATYMLRSSQNIDDQFYCGHCKRLWSKSDLSVELYISHIKACLDRHISELWEHGLVQRADDTYIQPRFNSLSPKFW